MTMPAVSYWGPEDEGSSQFGDSDDEPIYEVERIIAQREVDGADQYLVKWANFGDEDCTWEPVESFDQTLSISLWEEARNRGDLLDAVELQNVEDKMARHKAEHERKEAARQEKAARQQDRKISPDIPPKRDKVAEPKEPTATTMIQNLTTTTALPQKPTAAPVKTRQEFHGISDEPQTARRTTGNEPHTETSLRNQKGKRYRNLSHQNNDQKRRRQEPAPNIGQLTAKLRLASELVPSPAEDVALNLPSGPRRLPVARNPILETSVESNSGQFERIAVSERPLVPDVPAERAHQRPEKTVSHQRGGLRELFWNGQAFPHYFGEVVVQMVMGSKLIGHVKILGLASLMITNLLRTKQGDILQMQFEQEDAIDLQDYNDFARQRDVAIGSIEPYDNALDNFYRLLTFFNQHSRAAAVYRHEAVPWIMIIYSSNSAEFSDKGFPTASGDMTFITARSLPGYFRPVPTQPAPASAVAQISIQDDVEDLGTDVNMNMDADLDAASPTDANFNTHTSTRASMDLVEEKALPQEPNGTDVEMSKPRLNEQRGSIDTVKPLSRFEQRYGITYEHLTRIPATVRSTGSGQGKFNRSLVRFFLAFGEDLSDEEADLRTWLSTRGPAFNIFSASQEHDWSRYKEFLREGNHVGIILIHENFLSTGLGLMTGLARRLRREDLQVFRVSLSRPLYDSSLRHFARIFPNGLVINITEGFIISHPRETAAILEWFNRKKNWKLFLRPQPEQYLRELCETDLSVDDLKWHRRSLLRLRALRGPLPTLASPLLSSSEDEASSSSFIVSPLSLSVYSRGEDETSLVTSDTHKIAARDAKLLDFFSGWAYHQVHKYRKFVAILGDDMNANMHKAIIRRSHHVDFMGVDFLSVYAGKQVDMKSSNPAEGSPMSPAVLQSPVVK